MSSSLARHELLRARLDRFTRMLHGVEAGDSRAIHRTRVATRRLRELLPVLQLDGRTARKLGRRLRRVTRRLGAIRELDVLLDVMGELQKSRRYPEHVLGRITGDIRTARNSARDDLLGKPLVSELQRIGRKLDTAAGELKDKQEHLRGRGWHWAIDARVSRRATTLSTAIEEAGALYLPERLHVVRIALKKLRYAVEVGGQATGADRAADLKTLKRGQDLLGRLHDFQVLIDRVRRAQASLDPPDAAVSRHLSHLVVGLEQHCRRLHARYVRERSALAAVCARLLSRPARAARADRRVGPARATRTGPPASVRRAG
jgi:CHAD domain-containing protein